MFIGIFASSRSSLLRDIVSYWKFDSANRDLDELGTNSFTSNSGFSSGTGKINQCEITGTSPEKKVAANGSLSFVSGGVDTPFSVSMWVNFDTFSGTRYIIANEDNAAGEWKILLAAGSIFFSLTNPSTAIYINIGIATGGLSTGTWYHIVLTYDGSEANTGINAYVDNTSSGTRGGSGVYTGMTENTTPNFYIGNNWGDTAPFDGKIDEIGIWSKELTTSEVGELYNSGSGNSYPF